jgi:hypothetical protein
MNSAGLVDPFLDEIAVQNSIQAALQRSRTYGDESTEEGKQKFRDALAQQLRLEAKRYIEPISEPDHCAAIKRICEELSEKHSQQLMDREFRYGIAQKAFNLYLKFLWKFACIPEPPHCPIDGIVLTAVGIDEAWTWCKYESQYLRWIDKIKNKAKPHSLSEWEECIWRKEVGKGRNEVRQ